MRSIVHSGLRRGKEGSKVLKGGKAKLQGDEKS